MTLRSYITGFLLSLVLTFAAFGLVAIHAPVLFVILPLLAICQLVAQAVFFLHLGKSAPGWNRFVFVFAITIVIIIVGGSLWIMANLQHNQPEMFMGDPSPQHEL